MDGAEEPANGGCACGSGWRYTGVANSTGGITSGRARPAGTSKSAARAAAGVLFASEIGGALGMIFGEIKDALSIKNIGKSQPSESHAMEGCGFPMSLIE